MKLGGREKGRALGRGWSWWRREMGVAAQGQDSYRRSGGAGAVRLPGAREMREDDGGLRQRRKRGERDYADLWAPSDSAG
jgi:hypothetical protein